MRKHISALKDRAPGVMWRFFSLLFGISFSAIFFLMSPKLKRESLLLRKRQKCVEFLCRPSVSRWQACWLETDPLSSHGALITCIPRNIFSVSEECRSYLLFSNRSAVRLLLLRKSQVKDVRAGLDLQTDANNLQNMGQDQRGGAGGGLGGDSNLTTGFAVQHVR